MPLSQQQLAAAQEAHRDNGFLPPGLAAELAGDTPIEQLMLELLPLAQRYAIAPLSHFAVGAVSLGTTGALYLGANFELPGAALGFTVHAEQAATAQALHFGETGLAALAVSAAPCGSCRQFLYELTTASRLQIVMPDAPPLPLTSLLPDAFGPGDLGVTAALMSPQDHGLLVAPPQYHHGHDHDPLVAAALQAANSAYAPYTQGYAGAALRVAAGAIFSGALAEIAAFNPSLPPLAAALVDLAVRGGWKYDAIVDVVLVEVAGAAASQIAATRVALAALTHAPLRVYTAHPAP
jgi:cytidine deaminase